jgi:AGZA family xanthine/uracil permease-like MFS transporter
MAVASERHREVTVPDKRTEVIAGVTTFFTMSYIVIVNPSILSTSGTGMPFSGVLTATVLVCASMTLLMGLYAKLPFGVAPGMGLNAFFAYTVVLQQQVPWPVALGIVFWAGVLFLIVSATRLRESIAMAIPHSVRLATSAGIGLLLTFIGLRNAGFVAANSATIVGVGPLDYRSALALFGLGIIVWLNGRSVAGLHGASDRDRPENPLAFLASIVAVALIAWIGGYVSPPNNWLSAPDFSSVFLKLDILGALQLVLVPTIITVMLTDLFDSVSTFIGVAEAANLLDADGRPRNLRRGLIVDSMATASAGLFGSSPGTAYVESVSGIRMGGRTGLTAVVTAACFLPCLFIAPVVAAIPPYATSAVLMMVGITMFRTVRAIEFDRLETGVPAFVALILIPLTFSITQGILWGFILHVALFVAAGRRRDLTVGAFALAGVAVLLLTLEHLH